MDDRQTGFDRTGKMFYMEHWDVEPDVMPLAKALSGGALPIAAVLGSEKLLADCSLYLGGTFADPEDPFRVHSPRAGAGSRRRAVVVAPLSGTEHASDHVCYEMYTSLS